ncbi:MAG: hypothetical protein ACXWE4_03805 [Methylobacter sp.]
MTTKITPSVTFASLNHRVRVEPPTTPTQLSDCINPALERAAAIADLMEIAFEQDMEIVNNVSGSLWRVAQAVRLEINDAQAMLEAYVNCPVSPREQSDIAGASGKVKKNNRLEIVDGGKQ